MRRDQALAILRAHEAELRASGVLHLRLFGSVARDEATDQSDIDILADFAPNLGLLDISGLRLDLCDLLGAEVDLTSESWLKNRVRRRATQDAIDAF